MTLDVCEAFRLTSGSSRLPAEHCWTESGQLELESSCGSNFDGSVLEWVRKVRVKHTLQSNQSSQHHEEHRYGEHQSHHFHPEHWNRDQTLDNVSTPAWKIGSMNLLLDAKVSGLSNSA
jgi:hypothetical protein